MFYLSHFYRNFFSSLFFFCFFRQDLFCHSVSSKSIHKCCPMIAFCFLSSISNHNGAKCVGISYGIYISILCLSLLTKTSHRCPDRDLDHQPSMNLPSITTSDNVFFFFKCDFISDLSLPTRCFHMGRLVILYLSAIYLISLTMFSRFDFISYLSLPKRSF